jgi:hypothetical protein
MKRDVLLISGGILAVGLLAWLAWGNPDNSQNVLNSRAGLAIKRASK